MNWKNFWQILIRSILGMLIVIYAFIWLFNPYGNLPPVFQKEYVPQATNQRFSFPSLARNANFDSVVIGTSTSRLLKPEDLNKVYDAKFANLSMNSATAYEQKRLLEQFIKSHAQIKTVIIGLDTSWCQKGKMPDQYTFRVFPEWLYDDVRTFDILHMLDFHTIEIAGRQALFSLGKRKEKYGRDGYRSFLPDISEYNIDKARKNLYGEEGKPADSVVANQKLISNDKREKWIYPTHDYLQSLLAQLPEESQKILYFVPYHHYHQAGKGSKGWHQYDQCKINITRLAESYQNIQVVDFMFPSALTQNDYNYWDPLHYSAEAASLIVKSFSEVQHGETQNAEIYRVNLNKKS